MAQQVQKFSNSYLKSLPFSNGSQYVVGESLTPGFMVVIGKKSKSFTVQVPVKLSGKWTSRRRQIGAVEDLTVQLARKRARQLLSAMPEEEVVKAEKAPPPPEITLREAWISCQRAMEKKERSPNTIYTYDQHFHRYLSDWLDKPLIDLANRPLIVEARHDKITTKNGNYSANGAMRAFRAVYNHAAKKHRNLKGLNAVEAVDMNREERRQTALTYEELPIWFKQIWNLENGVRRKFHLLTLLTGSRPTALKEAKCEHISLKDRLWHFPKPKGGSRRAFDLPVSKPLLHSLIRIRKTQLGCLWSDADDYVIPEDSWSGHIEEIKESRKTLCKYGNDLRQSFRTFGEACAVSDIQLKMLMNHKITGVAAGYANLKPLWPLLLENQMRIAQHIFEKAGNVCPRRSVLKNNQKRENGDK